MTVNGRAYRCGGCGSPLAVPVPVGHHTVERHAEAVLAVIARTLLRLGVDPGDERVREVLRQEIEALVGDERRDQAGSG